MSIQLMMGPARLGVQTLEFHHGLCALKSPAMIAFSGSGMLAIHRSIVLFFWSGAWDLSL